MATLASKKLRSPRVLVARRLSWQENFYGWLFAMPWILGFILFTGGPILASAVMALTDWDIVNPPEWVGLGNFHRMFFEDGSFYTSLKVSTIYAAVSVPLHIILGVAISLLLNANIRGVSLYRTIYYMPAVLPLVAVAIMWRWIFSPDWGLLNYLLSLIGITGPAWLASPKWALPALIIMNVWSVGGSIVIYLAGLQGIPTDLYDAASVDGAGMWAKLRYVTLPMLSPVIFFQLVMGIIGSLQVFVQPYLMTNGGPHDSTLFFLLYLYRNAFQYFKMGYASALSWFLFIYIAVLTLLVFRSSQAWVYYEGELKR